MNQTATLSVTDRFALLVEGLCRAVAARIAARTMTGAFITLIWNRLRRIDETLQALAARVRAGTLRAGHTGPRRFAGRKTAQSPLPRGFGWLLPLVPQHAPAAASQLRHLLTDPEMAALIAATPRVAATLRPLARMLGLSADLLPPRPAKPPAQPVAIPQQAAEPALPPQPPPPSEHREPARLAPPPDEPGANARAGPDTFLWPWLLTELQNGTDSGRR